MLSTTGFGATPSPELVTLKKNVERCIRLRNSNSFTNDDQGASNNLFCTSTALGTEPLAELRKIEKLSFLEDIDNQLVFDVARTLIRQWRVMGMAGTIDRHEAEVRRIAAQKLTEVGALAPDVAVIQLSAAAREESDNDVLLRLINGLAQLISDTTAANIRTEAVTTLKILTQNPDPPVRKAAEVALQIVDKPLPPPTPTPPPTPSPVVSKPPAVTSAKKSSSYLVPIIATTATAVVAAGVLWFMFGRTSRRHAHALNAVGPLRRKVEEQIRRRRARSR